MNREKFIELVDDCNSEWEGDNIYKGLQIIAKYFDANEVKIITGVEDGILFSVRVNDIVNAGVTEEDAIKLCNLNWMIDEWNDCLSVYI